MVELSKSLNRQPWFHNSVLALILVNAVILGLETSATLTARFQGAFDVANAVIQVLFVTEIVIRLIAYWPSPLRFFRDGWNVFDFAVVAVSLLPVSGGMANIARLARVLRVTRLISLSEDLRLMVGTMIRSIPSMGHIGILLGILFYVYGIVGFHLFRADDPARWGTLGAAAISLFKVLTLEGWIEMLDAVAPSHPWAWLYFATFILFAVFVVANLFIAVVINNLENVKKDLGAAASGREDVLKRLAEVQEQLSRIENDLREKPPISG